MNFPAEIRRRVKYAWQKEDFPRLTENRELKPYLSIAITPIIAEKRS
jgi:hypothetical protein